MKKHFAPRAEWAKEGGEARPGRRRGLVRAVEDGSVPVGQRWEVGRTRTWKPEGAQRANGSLS
jgi:hypothetical protein